MTYIKVQGGDFLTEEAVKIIFLEKLENPYREEVWTILRKANMEFVPPLSARNSTYQKNMNRIEAYKDEEPTAYFAMMENQKFILALYEEKVIGFLTFISEHPVLYPVSGTQETAEYITTIVVSDGYRNMGVTGKLYRKMFELSAHKKIITRTWSTNFVHIHILEHLGFELAEKIENDRGEGIATVYYRKANEE
jgi:ribosomal protein S18 acetylase RimI-like enzyme